MALYGNLQITVNIFALLCHCADQGNYNRYNNVKKKIYVCIYIKKSQALQKGLRP